MSKELEEARAELGRLQEASNKAATDYTQSLRNGTRLPEIERLHRESAEAYKLEFSARNRLHRLISEEIQAEALATARSENNMRRGLV